MSDMIQTGVRVSVDLGTSVGNAQNFAKVISQVGTSASKASAEFKKSAQEISANARNIGAAMGMTKASDLAKSALEASKSLGMLGTNASNTKVQIQDLTNATEKYVSISSKLGMQTKTVLDHVAAWNKLSEVGMKLVAASDFAKKLSAASKTVAEFEATKAANELLRFANAWDKLSVAGNKTFNAAQWSANLAKASDTVAKFEADKAAKEIEKLAKAWDKLSESGMKRLAGSEFASKLSTAVPNAGSAPTISKTEGESQISILNRLKSGWMGLTAAFLSAKAAITTIGNFSKIADEYSGLLARTKLVSGTQKEFNTAMEATYQIALNTRSPLKEVTQLYYRMSVAMADAGKSQQDALSITDLVTKSLKISGASSTETASGLQQFSQAMQSTVVNGDEFRAILENMPRIATALTTALGINIDTLRKWSAEGKLTFKVITDALATQKAAIDSDFSKIPITVGGALTNLETAAVKWLGNADQSAQGTRKLAESIDYLARNLDTFANSIFNVVTPAITHVIGFFEFYSNVIADLNKNLREMVGLQNAGSQIDPEVQKLMAMGRGEWRPPEPATPYFTGQTKAAANAQDPKAQEQAQKVLEATIRQRIETERQAADLFKAQAETRLKALEAERDQMEQNFKLQLDSAQSFQQKENLNSNLVQARQDSLRKEFGIRQEILAVEGDVLKTSFDAYSEEIAKAKELGLKEQELIAVKTTKLGIENEVKILNETSAQQQIDLSEQLRKAADQAIQSKQKEKTVASDIVLEYQKELDVFLKLSAAKAAGATTEQLGVMKPIFERTRDLEASGTISKEQLATLQQYLISIEALKTATGELAGKEKDVREEALRTLGVMNSNLEYAKEVATGLTEAFDSVGAAIGGMAVALAEYGKQQATIEIQRQEEIKKAAGDPTKIAKAETEAQQKSAKAQIKNYGDITQAAQGFFKKGTAGYQAMGTAVKVFRAFEMAQSVMSAIKQIEQMGGLLTAFTESLATMGVLSDANATKEVANAAKGATAKAAEGAANQGSSGDPYSAFARVAAWVALMAGLGIAISGGASAAPTMTGKDYAKQQEETFAATLGSTVLGGAETSDSIQKSLDIIAENSTADLDYSRGLLKSFEDLSTAMTGLAAAVATSFKVNTGNLNLGKTTKYNFEDPGLGMLDNFLTKAIFGSTKITRELAGQGIELLGQNLGKIIEKGIVRGTQYADVLVTTKKSAFFGLISSTKQTIETVTSQLPKPINDAVVNVFTKLRDTFVKSAQLVGMGGASFMDSLSKISVNLGRIPFSENAKKNGELLNAAINRQADLMAKKLVPAYKESQIVGEGYFETFNRVANALTNGRAKLAQFNVNAISYAQIMNKKGDIEKQIVVQSILASNATSDLKDVMAELPGTADDAIAAFGKLVQIKDLFVSTGQTSVNLSNGLIVASGGIDKLKGNLETYFDLFFTDSEKLAATTVSLSSKFANFGLTMPALGETFDIATGKVVSARDGWRNFVDALSKDTSEAGIKLYAFALGMSGTFSEAVDLNMVVMQKSIDDQIAIYRLLGDTEKAISLERAKAVSAMSQTEKDLAISMYALEDAVENVKKATDNQIAVYKLLGNTEKVVSLERTKALAAMSTADKATAISLYALEDALDTAKKATDNQIAVYKLLGDTEKVISLERTKTLAAMTTADKAATVSLYALEDALNTAKKATDNQIAVFKLLGNTEKVTSLERTKALAAMSEADKAAALSLYALEDAMQAVNKSVDNQITIYKLLGEQDPAQKEKALALEREKAMAGMDQATQRFMLVVNSLTDANTALDESSTALQTAYENLTSMRDRFVDLGQGLRDYYNELTGAQSPNMTPEARYTAAKTAFTEVSALAAQGIQSALGDLPTVAREFLTVSREFNASGPTFQADFASVLTALQSGMSAADRQIEIMNKQLAEAEKSNANLLKVDASTSSVNLSVANLQVAIANFNSSLVAYNSATQAAVAEAIRQATAGSAASGVAAGAGAAVDTAKANADAAAAAAATKAKADADRAAATATAAAAEAATRAKADADRAAVAAAAEVERQRQAAMVAAAAAETERQRLAAEAAARIEAERQRQATLAAAAAAAAAKKVQDAEDYSSAIATYIRTGNFDNAKTIIDRATAAGFVVLQTAGANTPVKKSDDKYTVNGYAKGGLATPGMALVGEQGPELVNFTSPGQVYTAGQTQNILATGNANQQEQTDVMKAQVVELRALVKVQQTANIELIKELKGLKAEMAVIAKKAKLEASA